MKTSPLFLAVLCCVAILSPAALGREISSQGGSTCPCHLEPAHDSYPGSGEGNLMWNCRDRLLPSVPTSCWAANANVTQVTEGPLGRWSHLIRLRNDSVVYYD